MYTNSLHNNDNEDIVEMTAESRLEEFFSLQQLARTLRKELRDLKCQSEFFNEWEELTRKATELSKKMKEEDNIKYIKEKLSNVKERIGLITELIKLDMIKNGKEEIEKNGKKLKILTVVKEVKNNKKKK